ncbi:MAG: hypothetical protein IJ716_08285 [Lachnospiraceae bacterium]|nr:hypothetical protein [Lachnospiraceae bacterium]MBR1852680.1 hypothetical protein [Lachnospiraceae bacterium]
MSVAVGTKYPVKVMKPKAEHEQDRDQDIKDAGDQAETRDEELDVKIAKKSKKQ